MGEGISVTLGDPSAMLDEELVNEMLACCEENGIRYQRGVMDRGGTDASSMNQSGDGVRVAGIAVVDRYPHSKCSVIAKDDVTARYRPAGQVYPPCIQILSELFRISTPEWRQNKK